MASHALIKPLRESLVRATELRDTITVQRVVAHPAKTREALLKFELEFVFSHLLGRDLPDVPSGLTGEVEDRIRRAMNDARERSEELQSRPKFAYVVGNVWRWRGRRIFAEALASSGDTELWGKIWDVYSDITDAATSTDPPKYTWNEFLSQAVQIRRPMGLVTGDSTAHRDGEQTATVFRLSADQLESPVDLGESPGDDPHEDALDALSLVSIPDPDAAERINRLLRGEHWGAYEREQFLSCLEKIQDAQNRHWVEICRRFFQELHTPQHIEAVSLIFRSLYRYYLRPWKATAFYSFAHPLFFEADESNVMAVLSIALSTSLDDRYVFMLELLTNKILTPYVHAEVESSRLGTNDVIDKVARKHGLSAKDVDYLARTAAAEIRSRTRSVQVGRLLLPHTPLDSIKKKYSKGKAAKLTGQLIVGGLHALHNLTYLNLMLACGMVQKAPRKGLLLKNILGELADDHSRLAHPEFDNALEAAVDAEKLLSAGDDSLVEARPVLAAICKQLTNGELPGEDVLGALDGFESRSLLAVTQNFSDYCNKLGIEPAGTPKLDDEELDLIKMYSDHQSRRRS